MTPSTRPPAYAAIAPQETPITAAITVATAATPSAMRPPTRIRTSMSRPSVSVPAQCARDGGEAPRITSIVVASTPKASNT